jgi:hypothetical protein
MSFLDVVQELLKNKNLEKIREEDNNKMSEISFAQNNWKKAKAVFLSPIRPKKKLNMRNHH